MFATILLYSSIYFLIGVFVAMIAIGLDVKNNKRFIFITFFWPVCLVAFIDYYENNKRNKL